LIHPLREEFFDNPTEHEETAMQEHFEYLKEGVKSGQVILAGPCLDNTFGLVVLQVGDEIEANAFMMSDPSIKKNVMMAELHPFKISLLKSL
jgi:uncharacterized protein YciI